MLVTCRQMQELEERAFASGVSASDLMDQAGLGIAEVVRQFFPVPGTLILYLGSGNNGGDALVAAHHLQKLGWQIQARLSGAVEKLKPLPLKHWQSLSGVVLLQEAPTGIVPRPLVLLDGLLGIGSTGALRPQMRVLAAEMNALRQSHGAVTVAMDIPSGLDGDTGIPQEDAVVADITVTIGQAKQGLVADEAINHVGRLALVPLAALTDHARTDAEADFADVITSDRVRCLLPRREFDFHKGKAGRTGIIAGSRGFFGAAELCCHATLRAGAGLVTLLVKEDAYDILARRVPAEVMVKPVKDYREALDMRWDALGIGPGLGFDHQAEWLEIIKTAPFPMVVDADAITALARHSGALKESAEPRLLTPHPGEMARLMPDAGHLSRRAQAESWASGHAPHTLLLKGARTVIATAGKETLFNTTGHPGMATGGMGDVLTGVTAALAGQGLPLHEAAAAGAWLCGCAAEMHACQQAPESTLPSDVIANLGRAWAGVHSASH